MMAHEEERNFALRQIIITVLDNMDIILESHFNQFKQQFDLSNMKDDDAFELFVIYCVVSKYVKYESITKDLLIDLNVGNGGDWGIDGLIVLVNGKIVNTIDELNDQHQSNAYLTVQIILIQAKNSSSFDSAALGQTLDGAENLLRDVCGELDLPACNQDITDSRNLIKEVYRMSADFQEGRNPNLTVYYTTCGDYQKQRDFTSKIEATRKFISGKNLVNKFECMMIGKNELVSLYKETKSLLKQTIVIEKRLTMPSVDKVEQSFLCLIPFSEFKKLIIDENGDIIESVFNDNIRAFQGENTVNNAISQSLKNGEIKLFTAMNNGITIIAKSISSTGDIFHLVDYQIVNGCQTSHMLHKHRQISGIDDLILIVKIISSEDKDIAKKVIIGNNSQTEVKREQLLSLLKAQLAIEDYYNAQTKYEKLYYERRSKQYRNSYVNVPAGKVITISFQIKAYISMIMGKPEKVRGYYGKIVERFEKEGMKVFTPDNDASLYYTCALASHKMESLIAMKVIDRKYKKVKYHLLYAFRLMCENGKLSLQNGKKQQAYCNHLCDILTDEKRCQQGFMAALQLLNKALTRDPIDKDRMSKMLTNKLERLAQLANQRKVSLEIGDGSVIHF